MAELTKKLQVKSSGTTTSCKIYSTSAEAGASYVRAKVDNVEAYIPLVDASDDRASKVHIGSKCIATTGKPPYTEKSWTTAGTYTFTVPAGVTRIRVAVCGGGGGGAGAITSDATGGTGGTSSFSTVSATGGTGGQVKGDADGVYGGSYGTGGTPNGYNGSKVEYTQGFALNFTKQNGNYGRGGGAEMSSGLNIKYSDIRTGGSGGYNTTYLTVEPNKAYSIKVGAGGAGNGSSYYARSRSGTSGFVLIAFGGDI